MKALLITMGSRGDVQPYLALAKGLSEAGHRPLVAGPRRFRPSAAGHGIDYVPLPDETLDLRDAVKGRGARAAITAARSVKPMIRRLLDAQATLVERGGDVVVYHPKSLGGPYVAEKLGVPAIAGLLLPLYLPTAAFASPILPARPPRAFNRASWRVAAAVEAPYRGLMRRWRTEALGLDAGFRPVADLVKAGEVLHAWSPSLLPAPGDWPASAGPVGFWTLPPSDGWSPPERLVAFLERGDPPVYVGFGSMVPGDPQALTATVLEAVRRCGRRAVLATGWGGLRPPAPAADVLVIEEAPHDWLFPRVAAVVHHGGIGTVAAALRAGVPQVVRPFIGDQPFWAARLHHLGVAPAPLTARHLTAAALAAAITGAIASAPAARALGEQVSRENGVATAVTGILRSAAGSR
ncbi:glycosyltransferase [Bailinhaonella thermotolerans]|uniref:Glycosyltransferase n=1 Tax=Bailinhaonella thermotolerans TaxID=1070861 RepID=A0A3A4AZD6_9ACTN|nr:glycosyltransferase [Bailinhaonella thermotolerans]RJL35747.1 glycosyltransferase [Bailinhaonella thermotolerans]